MSLLPNKLTNSWINSVDHSFNQAWRKLVDDFFAPQSINEIKSKFNSVNYPKLDVYSTSENYVMVADVPGVQEADLLVEILNENDRKFVKITGKRSEIIQGPDGKQEENYRLKELRRSRFVRVESLPDDLDGDPEATLTNGVLTLKWKLVKTIPKKEDTKVIPLKKS